MLALAALLTTPAHACCAVIAGPPNAEPIHRATTVVALRQSKTTVLSLVADVQGEDAERLALIVPVPKEITATDVRPTVLEAITRADALSAPRLVELWHHDPCGTGRVPRGERPLAKLEPLPQPPALPQPKPPPQPRSRRGRPAPQPRPDPDVPSPPFAEIAVLSASSSDSGDQPTLGAWLLQNKLAIPASARAEVQRYADEGYHFAVARPDPRALVHENGRTVLPPLRIRTRSEELELPLSVTKDAGTEPHDLVVMILDTDRYEPARQDRAFAPTGLVLSEEVLGSFEATYGGLFLAVTRPGIAVTEYSWPASTCEPCAAPPLDRATVGALGGYLFGRTNPSQFVLTRIHLRYRPEQSGRVLGFERVGLVSGGNGPPDALQTGAVPAQSIDFQTRFVVSHRFTGEVGCEAPDWGRWGGPPDGSEPPLVRFAASAALTAVAPARPLEVAAQLRDRIGGLRAPPEDEGTEPVAAREAEEIGEAAGCATAGGAGVLSGWLLVLGALWRRR